MRFAMRFLFILIWAVALLVLIGGFLGVLHPAGDSLAVLRLPAAIAVILTALLTRQNWRMTWPSVLLAGYALAGIAMLFLPTSTVASDLRVYSKNLNAGNTGWRQVAEDILAADVDVVLLQEISIWNRDILNALEADFPYRHVCEFSNWSAMAVLSRHRATGEIFCSDHRGLAGMQLHSDDEAFWAISVHLVWPWPHGQAELLADAMPLLEELNGPIVLGGDFNMVPWGHSVARIAAATDTARLPGAFTTWRLRDVPLALDHILGPQGAGRVQLRGQLGSDHFGQVADLSLMADHS